jgi:hypothetical protein
MTFILIAVGSSRGNSLVFQGSITGEADRTAFADLGRWNSEGWPLSNAYPDRANMRQSKIARDPIQLIINER